MKIPFVTEILERVAPKIGAQLIIEPEYRFVGQIIFKNGRKTFYNNTNFNINSLGSVGIVKDKGYTTFFLKRFGYKVPIGQTFFNDKINENVKIKRTLNDGYLYAKEVGFPVILKPNSKSQGSDVVKVHNKKEYYKFAKKILKENAVMLIEHYYGGWGDYRIVVLDDKIISVYKREPLYVLGNGKASIKELLEIKQQEFIDNGRDTIIDFDDHRLLIKLKRQKFNLESVIDAGKKIYLLDNANLSTGGDAIDLTDEIHEDFKKIAVQVTKDVELRLCGVDILTSDITKSCKDYIILELNGAPGLDNYASIGQEQQARVDNLYLEILKSIEKENH